MRWPVHQSRGSLVLVAFCLIAVVGLGLAGYMSACYQSLNHSTREYYNRQARHLAEVGLEEALWQLNNGMTWSGSGPASSTPWTGTNPKTLNVTGYALGSGGSGVLAVSVNTTTYAITSTATVSAAGKTYTKTLTATTQRAAAFPNAIASAAGTVSFSSAGTIDSYDSTAAYNNPANMTYNAVIAGNNVTITNAFVRGYLATYGNSPSYNPAVADVIASGGTGVNANRLGRSAFIPRFPVTTPTPGSWNGTLANNSTATLGTNGGAVQYWRYTAANYSLSSANLTINGPVKIVVSGNFSISGTSRIRLNTGTTASLEMFVAGNVSVTSSAAFQNRIPTTALPAPANVALYVTGSGSTVTWNSAARFDGVIYATHANPGTLTFSNNSTAIYGAVLSNNAINFTGSAPAVHYDTDLRTATFAAITTPYIINTLSEVATER